MTITLNADYDVALSTALLGYVGETNARPVTVEGMEVDGADRYVLTIDYGDGTVYDVDISNGTWTPTADILRVAHNVSCQISARRYDNGAYTLVKKSKIFSLRIGQALSDGVAPIPSPSVAADALDRVAALGDRITADVQTAQSAAETATTAAENAEKSATTAGVSADTATQAASRAETAQTSAETSATHAETARQGADTARQQAVTAQNAAKISAAQAAVSAQQTTADKTATAGYAQTAKTNADSTASDRQSVQTLAEQVTADKAIVAENAAQVATDRKAAENAAQTALENADSVNQIKEDLDEFGTKNLIEPIHKNGTVDGITYDFDNGRIKLSGKKSGRIVMQTINGSVGDKYALSSLTVDSKPTFYVMNGSNIVKTYRQSDFYAVFEMPSETVTLEFYVSGTFDYEFNLSLTKNEIPTFPLLKKVNGENSIKAFCDITYEAIGDSLTFGFNGTWDSQGKENRINTPYPLEVKNILGFKSVINKGETGTTVANDLDKMGSYYPMSNDTRMNGFQFANIISIMGSTNDYVKGTTLGTVSDALNAGTFHAGWKKLFAYIQNRFKIYDFFFFVIIPPVTNGLYTNNSDGHSFNDYITATIEECRLYGIPYLDMSVHGRLCENNKSKWTSDGIHFNQEYTTKIFAPTVAEFIKQWCC